MLNYIFIATREHLYKDYPGRNDICSFKQQHMYLLHNYHAHGFLTMASVKMVVRLALKVNLY